MAKITRGNVDTAQKAWGKAIVDIGVAYTAGLDVAARAKKYIDDLYGYNNGKGKVLFKPTKCEHRQFRLTVGGALSYFVGHDLAKGKAPDSGDFPEDKGFAIATPFTSVQFLNAEVISEDDRAIAMGNYFFTDATGKGTKVEYTFGYRWASKKQIVIDVHHSSLPFINK